MASDPFGGASGRDAGRRQVLRLIGAAGLGALAGAPAFADAFRPDIEKGSLPHPIVGGTTRPSLSESATASRIIDASPRSSPLETMLYFEQLKEANADGENYNEGWTTRWNPVIVAFFEATSTQPQGDTTSWCAASLNWVLKRCGFTGGTGSASSGSFRDKPGRTNHPRLGDIVVFTSADPAAAQAGRGHVGLYLTETRNRIQVLGGNQTDPRGHSAMKRKWLDKSNEHLVLHSYHRIGAFA